MDPINLTSFSNTPQAKDDESSVSEWILEGSGGMLIIDVMANDLGGKAKTLYSVDDGLETNTTDILKDLAVSDVSVVDGQENTTAMGAKLTIEGGKVKVSMDADYLARVNSLGAGESFTDSFVYAIQLGNGTLAWAKAYFTVTGTNDAPVVAVGDVTGAVTEAGSPAAADVLTDSGTIAFTDADVSDTHSVSAVAASEGALGTLTAIVTADTTGTGVGGVVTWDYSVAASAVEYLADGEPKLEKFTFSISDGKGGSVPRTVTVTLTGTNDGPVISAAGTDAAAGVTERADGAADENDGELSDTGTISFSDVDLTDTHTASVGVKVYDDIGNEITAPLGSLTLATVNDETNTVAWTYSVDASAVDFLAEGQTLTQVYQVTIDDGHEGKATERVEVTITGTNDKPVIGGVTTSSVTEDANVVNGKLTTAGSLTISDADHGQATFTAINSVAGTYGTFSLAADGYWTYTADNGLDAIQSLGTHQTLTDSFTAVSSDGTAHQTVTVTINGTDEPVTAPPVTTTEMTLYIAASVSGNSLSFDGDLLGQVVIVDGTGYTLANPLVTDLSNQEASSTASVTIGSDGKLYASGLEGERIYTFTVQAQKGGNTLSETFRIITATNGVDSFTATGSSDEVIFADADGDEIRAGDGNDVIFGQSGNDKIHGGSGNDTLGGGNGADIFYFDTALNAKTNVDHIRDFSASGGNQDTIWLSKSVFAGLTTDGSTSGTDLATADYLEVESDGATAGMGGARILYDASNGNLYYDANGGSDDGRVLFAVLDNKPSLSSMDNSDFMVFTTS